MENACPWCSAEICGLLGCLLPPAPALTSGLEVFIPLLSLIPRWRAAFSLLPHSLSLWLWGSAVSCGGRLELSGTGCAQQGTPLSSSHRGHPAVPAAKTLTPAPNTVGIANNFPWGLVHDWELKSVNWCVGGKMISSHHDQFKACDRRCVHTNMEKIQTTYIDITHYLFP